MVPEWMVPSAVTSAVLSVLAVGIALPHLYRLMKGPKDYKGKHVLITGGSQGIGKELALGFVRLGAHVTIMARTESKLKAACEDIQAAGSPASKVAYVVADASDFSAVQGAVAKAEAQSGPVHVCVANAGFATPGYFLEQSPDVFRKHMDNNYMSAVHVIKAVAPGMAERREGQVTIVASAACVMAFIGYTAYCPSKFALRGLADALRNEFKGFGISVHVAYPPDTETPGFHTEETTKPAETSAFSKFIGGDPFSPASVSKCIIDGMKYGQYHLPSPDWMQNRLVELGAVVTPRSSPLFEYLTLPISAVVGSVVVLVVDYFGSQYGARVRKDSKKD